MKQDFPLCLWSLLPSPHHRSLPRTIERIICENQESLNCVNKLRSCPSLSVPLLADELVLYLICRKSFDTNTVSQSKESNFFPLSLSAAVSSPRDLASNSRTHLWELGKSKLLQYASISFPLESRLIPLGCRIDSLAYLPKSFDTDNLSQIQTQRKHSIQNNMQRIPEKKNSKIQFHKNTRSRHRNCEKKEQTESQRKVVRLHQTNFSLGL